MTPQIELGNMSFTEGWGLCFVLFFFFFGREEKKRKKANSATVEQFENGGDISQESRSKRDCF